MAQSLNVSTAILLLIGSCLTPCLWVGNPVRYDHLAIYASLLYFIGKQLTHDTRTAVLPRHTLLIQALAGAFLWSLLWEPAKSVGRSLGGEDTVPLTRWLASVENLLEPVVLTYIFASAFALSKEFERVLIASKVRKLVVLIGCVNSLIAIAQLGWDLSWLLQIYQSWEYDNVTAGPISIAGRAGELGRFTGLMNQPMEAGALSTLSLLALIREEIEIKQTVASMSVMSFAGAVLILGGVVGGSKIFMPFGLCLALTLMVGSTTSAMKLVIGLCSLVLVLAMNLFDLQLGNLSDGAEYQIDKIELAAQTGDYLSYLTGGRLGVESDFLMQDMFIETFTDSPILGFTHGSALTLDSGYLEYMYYGGVPALIAYIACLCAIAFLHRGRQGVGFLYGCSLTTFSVISSIGAPVVTMNKVAIIFFAMIFFDGSTGRLRWPAGARSSARPNGKVL